MWRRHVVAGKKKRTTFSDGLPVTLRFADLVAEILTAGPTDVKAPLPFKFYI